MKKTVSRSKAKIEKLLGPNSWTLVSILSCFAFNYTDINPSTAPLKLLFAFGLLPLVYVVWETRSWRCQNKEKLQRALDIRNRFPCRDAWSVCKARVKPGFSPEMVEAALGQPRQITEKKSAAGELEIIWRYSGGRGKKPKVCDSCG